MAVRRWVRICGVPVPSLRLSSLRLCVAGGRIVPRFQDLTPDKLGKVCTVFSCRFWGLTFSAIASGLVVLDEVRCQPSSRASIPFLFPSNLHELPRHLPE